MYYNPIEIGKRIEEARNKKNLSREALAEMVDVTAKTIYNLEQGATYSNSATLIDVIHALGMDYNYAITGKMPNAIPHELLADLVSVIHKINPDAIGEVR